jgi:hypothetical protein
MQSSPTSFAASIAILQNAALLEFDRQISTHSLHYHNRDHVVAIQHRSHRIFQAVQPCLDPASDPDRAALLLDLCAITHDLIQIFIPGSSPHSSRRREAGISESATIDAVFKLIATLPQPTGQDKLADQETLAASFTAADLSMIQEAIAATICEYDPEEQAIFQPMLYRQTPPISLITRILAMADIGSLGMEGIESYHAEGRLIFLEENPDVYQLIANDQIQTLSISQPELAENVRQRLLKRARFQVSFAKSRLHRSFQELAGFPAGAIAMLIKQIFPYLTADTIRHIELITPTSDDASLESLLAFFQFDRPIPSQTQSLAQNLIEIPSKLQVKSTC